MASAVALALTSISSGSELVSAARVHIRIKPPCHTASAKAYFAWEKEQKQIVQATIYKLEATVTSEEQTAAQTGQKPSSALPGQRQQIKLDLVQLAGIDNHVAIDIADIQACAGAATTL